MLERFDAEAEPFPDIAEQRNVEELWSVHQRKING